MNGTYTETPAVGCGRRRMAGAAGCLALVFAFLPLSPPLEGQTLRVGIYDNPPLVDVSDQAQPRGFYIDLLEAAAADYDWTLQYEICAWPDCLSRLESSELDLLVAVAASGERRRRFEYSRESVINQWGQLFVPAGSSVGGFQDLEGARVALLREDIFGRAFRDKMAAFDIECTWVFCGDFSEVLRALERGRADAGVVNRFFGRLHQDDYAISPTDIIFHPVPLFFAAPPGEHTDVLGRIDQCLRQWKHRPDTPYTAALDHWLDIGTHQVTPGWVIAALWIGGAGAVLVLVGFILTSRRLRDQLSALRAERHQRTRVEDLAREGERRYQLLFRNLPIGLFHFTSELIISDCNQAFADIIGTDRDKLIGLDMRKLNDTRVLPAIRAAVEGREGIYEGEYQTTTSGITIHTILRTSPLHESSGSLQGGVGILEDITQRTRSEQEMRRLSAAMDQALESIVITDPGGVVQYVNPTVIETTQRRRDELLGKDWGVLLQDEEPGRLRSSIDEALKAGRPWTGRLTYARRDGDPRIEEAAISPVRDIRGRVINVVMVTRDVSREVRMEEQLRQSQKMEAIGRLAAGIAHDFNNLLQVIQGNTHLLQQADSLDSESRAMLKEMLGASERAALLVRQMLTFGKRDALAIRPLDVNGIMENLVQMLERAMGERIVLDWIPEPALPPIEADKGQVEQVILNLCLNARDAISGDGRIGVFTRSVEFSSAFCVDNPWANPGRYVEITVEDDGEGIPADQINRIFEPFYTTKQTGEGSGLGLFTVYAIAQQAGGFLNVESAPGAGSRFCAYLPVCDTPAEAEPPVSSDRPKEESGTGIILLAEDEQSIRRMSARLLGRAGYELLIAEDGAQALNLYELHKDRIDLALLDIIMPRMTGRELLDVIHGDNPELPVLLITGYGPEIPEPDEPATMVLRKPLSPENLLGAVRSALDGRRPGRPPPPTRIADE